MSMSAIYHRFLRVLATVAVCATATGASAQQPSVAAPHGAKLLLEAAAQGVQIYTCETGSDGYHWVFSAPDAALFDTAGRQIGTHFAGPTWQMEDGSKIVGEVEAQAPAPEPHAVAWLLLRVKSHAGNDGVLSSVGLVRRIDTHAGTAPATACDAAHAATQARMRYTARYLFYATP
jgi:hypothetical protein